MDPRAVALADRHYARQKHGSDRFGPPGRALCLLTAEADAVWLTSWPRAEYVRHAWGGAWVCSAFRNEGRHLSSELIREAVAATRYHFGEPPALGMVTFVDDRLVRRKRDPGRCFLRAGFVYVLDEEGNRVRTRKRKKLVLLLAPGSMPPAQPPAGELDMRGAVA